jgi:transcriptional regulator with XRE-family HTH domain
MRKWLMEIRAAKGLSTYAAAELCGISHSYYSSIENGTRGAPLPVDTAKLISAALGFDWKQFYEDTDEQTA